VDLVQEIAFMSVCRPWRAAAAALFVSLLMAPTLLAQKKDDKKDPSGQPKLSDAQRQELTPLVKTIDEVMKNGNAGTFTVVVKENNATLTPETAAPVAIAWRNDFLKATNQLIYVPFVASVEPTKIGTSVAGYLRVAPKGSTGAPAAAEGKDAKKDDKKKGEEAKSQYPFEDVYFTDLRAPAPGQPLRLTRAFAVPAGAYDVYLALREHPSGSTNAEAPVKVAVLKQELTVPNFWSSEFTTSSVILADKVEPLSAPLTPEAQRERPYVLGATEIVPASDNKFKKTEELGIIFQVYGYTLGSDKKPDVQIEYIFHQKDASGTEKPFNKTEPQKFNAQTLPPTFDPEQGHQIVGGQMIPLASFPEGDFRLEIKITDNKATKSITREVLFSVVPPS
jgi:hypothetical protein